MNYDFELLSLQSPVGKGQENNPDDIEAIDARLRKINAYSPPPEYADNPQRYATEPMIGALERYQERNRLKIDGVANPGGPTERAINNHLLEKPRGAGLLYDPPSPLAGTVGNGFENRPKDVAGVQRRLGALNYLPEDPFDRPHGFIDEATTNGIKAFQRANGLIEDGWLAPRGETERALENAVSDLARAEGREWFAFLQRAGGAQQAFARELIHKLGETMPREDEEANDIVLTKSPPGGMGSVTTPSPGGNAPRIRRGLEPRGLLEVDPRYLPPPRINPRNREPFPRDAIWTAPGPRPQQPIRPRVPLGPPAHETGPISVDDVDRALRRERLPNPDELKTYTPEPGSPLAIPILGLKRPGRLGDERTIETNTAVAKTIEKACKDVMKDAKVVHYGGPGSINDGEKAITSRTEGRSFPDFETQIHYKGFTIHIFGDSYTPKVDRQPNAREQRQFGRLQRIAKELGLNSLYVRLPKPWLIGEEIDPDKLAKFTKELCKEVKKAVDEGRIGHGKDGLSIEQFFEELTKAKKPAPKRPEDPEPGLTLPKR